MAKKKKDVPEIGTTEPKPPAPKKTVNVYPVPNLANKDRVLRSVADVGKKFPALGPWTEELSLFIRNRL